MAVTRFLDGTLAFTAIPALLEAAVERFGGDGAPDPDLDELIALDAEVRLDVRHHAPWSSPVTGFVQSIITIVLFLGILGVLVVIHELGHFVTARLANVRVLEFGIGFPPRAKVLRSKGETLYTLNWLPIGGFVKLEGEDGEHARRPAVVRGAEPADATVGSWSPASLMNVLLAFVIFARLAMVGDPTLGMRVGGVQPDSPAAAAGLQAGDVVASVNGVYYNAFAPGSFLLDDLRANAGTPSMLGHRACGWNHRRP